MKRTKIKRVIIALLLCSVVIASLAGVLVILDMASQELMVEALTKMFAVFGIVALACIAFIALLETSKEDKPKAP